MKKNVRSVNEQQIYTKLMREIAPSVKRIINESMEECDELEEGELNELSLFGSSVKKPAAELSLENSDEENAEIFIQYCEYYLAKAGNNVAKGLALLMEKGGKLLVKMPLVIVKGILKLISGGVKLTVAGASAIAGVIVMGVSLLVKMVASGVEKAKECLTKLYSALVEKAKSLYAGIKKSGEEAIKAGSDKFQLWLGIASALCVACATKLTGAMEMAADYIKEVINDAKEKVIAAVVAVKSWMSAKAEEVKAFVGKVAGNVREAVVNAWNSLDKGVRKAYNEMGKKLEEWMNNLSALIDEIGKKISDAADATKGFVIDKKDKALVYGIQKAIKGLSDKFKEEEVVALVRKAYNESLKPDLKGNFRVNEAYFHARGSKQRKLYESRRAAIKNRKSVNS